MAPFVGSTIENSTIHLVRDEVKAVINSLSGLVKACWRHVCLYFVCVCEALILKSKNVFVEACIFVCDGVFRFLMSYVSVGAASVWVRLVRRCCEFVGDRGDEILMWVSTAATYLVGSYLAGMVAGYVWIAAFVGSGVTLEKMRLPIWFVQTFMWTFSCSLAFFVGYAWIKWAIVFYLEFVVRWYRHRVVPLIPAWMIAAAERATFKSLVLSSRAARRESRLSKPVNVRKVAEARGLKDVHKERDMMLAMKRAAKEAKFVMFKPRADLNVPDVNPVSSVFPDGYSTQTRGEKFAGSVKRVAGAALTVYATKKAVDVVVDQAGRIFNMNFRERALVAAALLSADTAEVRDAGSQGLSLFYDCVLTRSLGPLSNPAPIDLATALAALAAHADAYALTGDSLLPQMKSLYNTCNGLKAAMDARGGPPNAALCAKYVTVEAKYRLAMATRQAKKTGFKPFILNVFGPPGTGKSNLLQRIYATVIDEIYGGANVDRDQVIDKICLDDKYDSTSTPMTTIGHLDDAVMTGGTDGVEAKAHLIKLLWGASTGDGRIAVKAAVEEKGAVRIHYNMIGWASNKLFNGIHPYETADGEAFARRIFCARLDWQDPSNHPSINEAEYLATGQATWNELMEGRQLTFGTAVVDSLVYKFQPIGEPFKSPVMIMAAMRAIVLTQIRTRMSKAADKNAICAKCWEYGVCEHRVIPDDLMEQCVIDAKIECGGRWEAMTASWTKWYRDLKSIEPDPPIADVKAPGFVVDRDEGGAILGMAGAALNTMTGGSFVLPVTLVNVFRATSLSLGGFISLWFFPYWTLLLVLLETMSAGVCVGMVNPVALYLVRLHDTLTMTIWDFGAVVGLKFPALAVPVLGFARWRSSFRPGWIKAYTSTNVIAVPAWATMAFVVCLVGLWAYVTRKKPTEVEKASAGAKPVVGRINLDDYENVAQVVESHVVDDVVTGKVAELDDMKSLAEKVWSSVGVEADVVLKPRVAVPTLDPVVVGPKSRTATYSQIAGSMGRRDILMSSSSNNVYYGVSHGTPLVGEWVQMTRHGVPRAAAWEIKYQYLGARLTYEFEGDVGEPNVGEAFCPKGDWIAWKDILLVRFKGFACSLGVLDYMLTSPFPNLVGFPAVVVKASVEHVQTTVSGVLDGQIVIFGGSVAEGWSGSQVWVNMHNKPVFIGQVSRSSDVSKMMFLSPVTRDEVVAKIKLTSQLGINVVGASLPASWVISRDVDERSAIFFDGCRCPLGGVVTNLPKQKIAWRLRDPLPEFDLGKDLWAARDVGHLVFDDEGKTKLNPVGSVDGRPVVWLDGFATTRVEMAKVQVVQGWSNDLLQHTVDVAVEHLWSKSKLKGWTKGLTTRQAAFGVDGVIGGVNVASAAGPSWPGKLRAYVTKPVGLNEGKIDERFEASVNAIHDEWLNGIASEFVGKVSVKAEARKMSKHVARNIFVFNGDKNIALKREFGLLAVGIGQSGYKNGILTMINAASKDFSRHFSSLHQDAVNILDADKETMDWSQNPKTWHLAAAMIDKFCRLDGVEDVTLWMAALAGLQTGWLLVGRLLFYARIGMGSGWWVTSFITSLLEHATVVAACVLAGSRVSYSLTTDVYSMCVKPAVCGDDDCTQMLKAFCEKIRLTPGVFREACEALGFRVTAGDKSVLDKDFASKVGLRFLKRSLNVLRDGSWRDGQLELSLPVESLFKSLYVVEASVMFTPKMHADVIGNAWRETLLFPAQTRRSIQDVVLKLCDDFEAKYCFKVPLMDESDFRGRWEAGTFLTFDSQ